MLPSVSAYDFLFSSLDISFPWWDTDPVKLVLEDNERYAKTARGAANNDVRVFQDPAEALQHLDEYEAGVFSIFQPYSEDEELNALMDRYIERLRKCDPSPHIPLSEMEKTINSIELRFEQEGLDYGRDGIPYGAALAYEFVQQGGDAVFCSDIHCSTQTNSQHKYASVAPAMFNGWILLFPFYEEGLIPVRELRFFQGEGPTYFGGKYHRKNDEEMWSKAFASVS